MTLKEQCEAMVRRFEADDPESFRGHDWCQLSDEEAHVFAIDRARFPRMLVGWMLYQCLADIVDPRAHGFDEALIEAERAKRPGIKTKDLSEEMFRDAAMELAGLTMRECAAMWAKADFWDVRHKGVRFADEGA